MLINSSRSILPDYINLDTVKFWSSGTAALYSILLSLRHSCKKVLVTDSTCFQVILPCIWLNYEIKLIDISIKNLQIDKKKLYSLMKSGDIIIWVHQYGYISNLSQLRIDCDKNNIVLIEDACQSFPSKKYNNNCGAFGHFGICSFGEGKIVSTKNGGGLSFGYHEKSVNNSLFTKSFRKKIKPFNHSFNYIYNNYFSKDPKKFQELIIKYINSIDYLLHTKNATRTQVNEINEIISFSDKLNISRIDNYLYFLDSFKNKSNFDILYLPENCAPWRIIIRSNHSVMKIFYQLLEQNLNISSWYPSLSLCIYGEKFSKENTPNSFQISDKLLNLWCDETIGKSYYKKIIEQI